KNQLAGFTGAGEELKFPSDPAQAAQLRKAGLFEPIQTGEPAQGVSQNVADFINMLYSIRPPKTPRAGKPMPRNISNQMISEATQPGRVGKPSLLPSGEDRAPFSPEVEAKYGVSEIQEVNPLRAKLEKALQANGTPLPETIEAVRRLNVGRIHSVEPEPSQPPIAGGNILTLGAGFQSKPGEPRAIRSAAVRDEHGKIFEGAWHGEAFMKAQEAPGERGNLEEGFINNEGKWYDRATASKVAEEIGQLPVQADRELESGNFERTRAFQPKYGEPIDYEKIVDGMDLP